jgi:hypothetical protein
MAATRTRPGGRWYNPRVLLFQPAQPITPLIVKVMDAPTKEISVADILMGSVGITGLFLLGAAIFGFLLGGAFIAFRRWRDRRDEGEPGSEIFHLTRPPHAT